MFSLSTLAKSSNYVIRNMAKAMPAVCKFRL